MKRCWLSFLILSLGVFTIDANDILTEPCTAVIIDTYGAQDDDLLLYCQTPAGLLYNIPGVSSAWIRSKRMSKELVSGITLIDVPEDTTINTETQALEVTSEPMLTNPTARSLQSVASVESEKRTVLGIIVRLKDGLPTVSNYEFTDQIFGTYQDRFTLKSQYSACSRSKLEFEKAADRNGLGAQIRLGAVSLILPSVSKSAGRDALINAVTGEITRQFGVSSPNELADHVMYCLPEETLEGVAALAAQNGWFSAYRGDFCISLTTTMHEIGHNLGLAHSGVARNEYADLSCLMGQTEASGDGPLYCFNPPKSWQLGWYRDKAVTFTPGENGVYTWEGLLTGVADYQVQDHAVLVKIVRKNEEEDIFLGFNAAKSFNIGVRESQNEVVVVEAEMGGESTRLASLSASQSYSIDNFDGNQGETLAIQVTYIINTEVAFTQITLRGPSIQTRNPAIPPTDEPTKTPTNIPTNSPTENCQANNQACGGSFGECCTGLICRRVSPEPSDPFLCRRIAKTSKDKLPRKGGWCRDSVGPGCRLRRRLERDMLRTEPLEEDRR